MTKRRTGLKLSDYQAQALKADRSPGHSLAFPLLGLFGETGSLLSVVKKNQRDKAAYLGYAPHVVEELGDVLWYFTVVAARGGVALSEVANNINRDFSDWKPPGGRKLRFPSLPSMSSAAKAKPNRHVENNLVHLARHG